MRLSHVAHPRALLMVLGSLAIGGAYFTVAAPPTQPGAYVLMVERQAHRLPAQSSAPLQKSSLDLLLRGPLPDGRPEHFYLFDPLGYDPPLDPASANLWLVALPIEPSRASTTDPVSIPVSVTEVNSGLYTVRSAQLDGPWVRLRYNELASGADAATRPVLALTLTSLDGRTMVVFGLSIERLW